MAISITDVEKIAHLSRLTISDSDKTKYAEDLTKILDFIEQMNQIDTAHIEPMAHPLNTHQRLREDKITENNQRELLQSMAPKVVDGLYLVPQVIE